jgi:hypothetical protein
MMKKKLLGAMLSAFCLGLVVACKPQEPPKPNINVETAEVEAKIQKLKAAPKREKMEEADRALADMNARIKNWKPASPSKRAEKDRTVGKLSAFRTQYNLYRVEIVSVKAQAVTGRALEKARDASRKPQMR